MTDDIDEKRKKVEQMRQDAASAYGKDTDPLASIEDELIAHDIDPLFMFEVEVLEPSDVGSSTRKQYDVAYRQWKQHMEDVGRHYACPNERHVLDFVRYLRSERGNTNQVVRQKLNKLNRAYEYWQNDSGLGHPTGFNPFKSAREKVNLSAEDAKPFPRLTEHDVRDVIEGIDHIGYRAIVGTQLKLGLRRGELCNIKLEHVNLQHSDVRSYYDEIGTHPQIVDKENAIYIPPNDESEGNKSKRPRVLPLDRELRQAIVQYLLIRPTVNEPWLFVSKRSFGQLRDKSVNEAWKHAFWPQYEFDDEHQYRSITSHYGRHFFSNHWETELAARGLPLKYILYMRGDKVAADESREHSIDHYLQAYYEDIAEVYVDGIYELGLANTY